MKKPNRPNKMKKPNCPNYDPWQDQGDQVEECIYHCYWDSTCRLNPRDVKPCPWTKLWKQEEENMKVYIITTEFTTHQEWQIEAFSEEDARSKLLNGEGIYLGEEPTDELNIVDIQEA